MPHSQSLISRPSPPSTHSHSSSTSTADHRPGSLGRLWRVEEAGLDESRVDEAGVVETGVVEAGVEKTGVVVDGVNEMSGEPRGKTRRVEEQKDSATSCQ